MSNITTTDQGIAIIEGETGGASYAPDTNTLTLENVIITKAYNLDGVYSYICSERPLNIALAGSNILSSNSEFEYPFENGIYVKGNLTISGNGELETSDNAAYHGIYVYDGDITISGVKLTLICYTRGIYTNRNFYLSSGDVSISTTSPSSITGIACNVADISGGSLIAKCYGNFNTNSAISSGDVRFTNGITIASTNPDGGSMLYIAQSIDHNFSDSNYKYVYYTDDSDTVKLNIAKELIEGADYTMTQVTANTVTDVKAELLSQIISLTGMDETGVVISEADIAISEFEAAEAGTSANPAGESGSFRFTVNLSKGAINFSTISITGTITATAYTGLTDAQAVAAAKVAIVGETVTVAYGADQIAKTAAVQSYVNSLLTGDAAGVTAVVSFISDNTYRVDFTLGLVEDNKNIDMVINEGVNPDIAKVNTAKTLIETASYIMTQVTANTVTDVKTELLSQIISLTGMDETGVVISEADIAISEFEAAEAGTSANPAGESGSFRFTVYLSKGAINFSTISITGAITATAYTGLTDAQAVAAAKTAIVGGTVTVDHGADQIAKVAAVQSYVNSLLTGDAAGVTAVVSFISDNTYIVELTLGSIVDSKSITMTIYENELPTPTPTPTPAPEVNVTVTGDYIRFGIKLTPDTIEYYNGQINIPITSRELMIELAKKEGPGVSVMVNLPELSDEVNQAEINLILRSEIIKLAKENGKSISVDVVDSDNNILYSWTFDSEGLADSDKEIKDVNLSLKVDKAPEDAPFADDQKDNEDSEDAVTLVIDFAHNGLLPTQASVRVYVGHME